MVESITERELAAQLFEESRQELGSFNYSELCKIFGQKLRARGLDPRKWIQYFQKKLLSYV